MHLRKIAGIALLVTGAIAFAISVPVIVGDRLGFNIHGLTRANRSLWGSYAVKNSLLVATTFLCMGGGVYVLTTKSVKFNQLRNPFRKTKPAQQHGYGIPHDCSAIRYLNAKQKGETDQARIKALAADAETFYNRHKENCSEADREALEETRYRAYPQPTRPAPMRKGSGLALPTKPAPRPPGQGK